MTDAAAALEITRLSALAEVSAADWDACAGSDPETGRPADPFTTHRFLSALERSRSVGPGTGWQPDGSQPRKPSGC